MLASPLVSAPLPETDAATMVRVLVADDEPALREALAELFAQESTLDLIGLAADAEEAATLASRELPDVALVDVSMPAGGGPRAAREIARTSPHTRVIALSAFEDRTTVMEMLRAGAVGYLVKGTNGEDIVESIHRVASGRASMSADVVDGIVLELSSQLRREEIEQQRFVERASEIQRFAAGDGIAIHVQPIVDLLTLEPVGFEALARFRSLPLRPPDEWFAEAAVLELGIQLEHATIERALALLPALPGSAYLSLNASHRAAQSPELRELLAPHAERLVVEITEHEPVEDYDALAVALQPLRDLGVKIAIDDAGAGYASLRHTLALDPDIVKVDIALTSGIDTDRAKRALASALISFAEEMDITIVAEGIETEASLRTLVDLGVRYGQGFHIARPAPLGS
jgi:EAL domain-containing protein (putative c-di-GMP-specific phosphodiesterase class I)/CheY-like chemotaxis protein